MKTTALEREILGQLELKPALFESCDSLNASLFSAGDERAAFMGIAEQWEELRPEAIDLALLSRKTGLSATWLAGLIELNFRPDTITFGFRVSELQRQRLGASIQALTKEAGDALVKTGETDPAILQKLRAAWVEMEGLTKPAQGPAFKRLAEVESRSISWLWTSRLPLGMLSLLVGDPGLGKSFLATWAASRLSIGAALPGDGTTAPGSTVYLSAEDSPAYALRPRAEKNGADLGRIYVLEDSAFDISADLIKIRAIVAEDPSVRLIIIDPLNSYIGDTDYFKDPAVRAKLKPLVQFAEEKGVAALAVMHLNKKTDQAGIYRIGGSVAFAGIARSVLAVTQDPDDKDRRFLRPIKMNYCKKPDSLAFRIGEDLSLAFEDGPALVDADDSLTPPTGREAVEGSFVETWLRDQLSGEGADLKDLLAAAGAVKISRSALFRARAKLGVKTRPFGFKEKKTSLWELPE